MTGWLIFFGIIFFILGVLMLPVRVAADYKEELSVKIKFLLFFKITLVPMKEKKEKKKEVQETEKEEASEKPKKKKRRMTLEETVDFIIDCVRKYGPGAKMILRNIRFHRLELYWKVGAEDAAACGIKYGRICAWISGALGFLRNLTRIEKTKLRIFPDFICENDEIYGGADIEFNPLIVLIGALRMAFVFLKDIIGNSHSAQKTKAAKPRQNIAKKESA